MCCTTSTASIQDKSSSPSTTDNGIVKCNIHPTHIPEQSSATCGEAPEPASPEHDPSSDEQTNTTTDPNMLSPTVKALAETAVAKTTVCHVLACRVWPALRQAEAEKLQAYQELADGLGQYIYTRMRRGRIV